MKPIPNIALQATLRIKPRKSPELKRWATKMYLRIFFGFVFITTTISTCGAAGYEVRGDKVFHVSWGSLLSPCIRCESPVDADAKSFKAIPLWKKNYGKDATAVFNLAAKINGADPDSFVPLNDLYSKDAKHAFAWWCQIDQADVATFTPIEIPFAKDKYRAYYFSTYPDCKIAIRVIPSTDTESFVLLNRRYTKDKKNVFFDSTPIPKADPATFQAIDESYGKDRNYVFYREQVIPEADPESFTLGHFPDARDKNNFYRFGKLGNVREKNKP